MCAGNYRDEFANSDDEGSISLDEDDGSDMFENDFDEDENDSNLDVSDPEEKEPNKKRMKAVSNKDFQKRLKHTTSKCVYTIHSKLYCLYTIKMYNKSRNIYSKRTILRQNFGLI